LYKILFKCIFFVVAFTTSLEAKIDILNFTLLPHNENYLLFGGYTNDNLQEKYWDDDGKRDYSKDYVRNKSEVQFQISLKTPIVKNFLKADLYFAYTQKSFWQIYEEEKSRPFRETNYMPEFFLQWNPSYHLKDNYLKEIQLALIHQSNGQDLGASRSWNRTQLHLLFQNKDLLYGIDIWHRWQEDEKEDYSDPSGDDNPNLENYIGKQKIFIRYSINDYSISLSHQNDIFNYDSSKGNTKIDINIPSTNQKFDFFIRYFNGYGESLIDYDVKIKRASFGVIFSTW